MFFVEGRALGVFAALGLAFAMVRVFDRATDVADPTEPRAPPAIATAGAAAPPAPRRADASQVATQSVAAARPSEGSPLGEPLKARPPHANQRCSAAAPDRPARCSALHGPVRS
jgi:hypothetical protein